MESLDKTLFDHFPYAHILVRVGPEHEIFIARCNPVAAELYGLEAHATHDKNLSHVFEPHMADFLEKSIKLCLKDKNTLVTKPLALHTLTEAKQSFTLIPILNARGIVTHVDIMALPADTDKLSLQKERDHALMLMSSVFDTSNLGIFVTDRHRRILRVNDAFLTEFGFKRRDILGLDFTQVFVPADRRFAAKSYKNFLGGQQSEARHEWRLRAPSNKEADVLVTTAPLYLNPDRPLMVHTFVDISEHKHLEESLRWAKDQADSANRAKSAFLASMSHELRTPLNAILGFSELMRNETFGAIGHAKYKEYLHDIHFAATHLLEIINDVLDMSKIEAGKFELVETEVDVAALFQSISRLMSDRANNANIIIETDVGENMGFLLADKRVLRQMLINLVSNALKFSNSGATIKILARVDSVSGDALLVIRDEGRGMDPRDIDRMMEPFNQGQASISDGTGTGLGLPLTRAMAELHGGTLKIDSHLGRGTTVTIHLPQSRILFLPKSKMKHANLN